MTAPKEEIVKTLLKYNIVYLSFTKEDESVRGMYATLREDLVEPVEKKTKRTKKENPEVQAVWDTEAKAWRSFRWDRLQNYSLVISAEDLGLR